MSSCSERVLKPPVITQLTNGAIRLPGLPRAPRQGPD
ncbi:hypothetical protein ANO14919_095680 [Xylariales sp. No.14919]|nr:hypothetical protein ANO14919_095680 [Xylariales sp. No.14919]